MESIGIDFLTKFWEEKYLREYIREGGSKIKFITGRPGSGKTRLLEDLRQRAEKEGYLTVHFSAKEVWLHDFREIYLEIFRQCDFLSVMEMCANSLIREMGFEDYSVTEEKTFLDYLSEVGSADALTKREIRNQLKVMFLDNPRMDNNFALCCSLLTGGIIGHPMLEPQNKELLLNWLNGDKTVKLALLRTLGLSPARITKYNARHMLRSLAEAVRIGGAAGIFVTIDDLEILLNRSSMEEIHYTKLRREDTYESIRQLIDEIDSLRNIMIVYGFDRALIDNENYGLKSYQALWMRIQNEITGSRFNRFVDVVDMDKLAHEIFTPEQLVRLSEEFLRNLRLEKNAPIDLQTAEELIKRSYVSGEGLPMMLYKEIMGYAKGGVGDV